MRRRELDTRTHRQKVDDRDREKREHIELEKRERRQSARLKGTGVSMCDTPAKKQKSKDWPVAGMHITIKGVVGEWLVVRTDWTGGGTGHGPHDVFHDGYQVTCSRVGEDYACCRPGEEITHIRFYIRGTGCFVDSVTVPRANILEVTK